MIFFLKIPNRQFFTLKLQQPFSEFVFAICCGCLSYYMLYTSLYLMGDRLTSNHVNIIIYSFYYLPLTLTFALSPYLFSKWINQTNPSRILKILTPLATLCFILLDIANVTNSRVILFSYLALAGVVISIINTTTLKAVLSTISTQTQSAGINIAYISRWLAGAFAVSIAAYLTHGSHFQIFIAISISLTIIIFLISIAPTHEQTT